MVKENASFSSVSHGICYDEKKGKEAII